MDDSYYVKLFSIIKLSQNLWKFPGRRRGEDSNLEILDKIPGQCCQNVRDFDEQKTGGMGEGKLTSNDYIAWNGSF